jgi:hypothetical protein
MAENAMGEPHAPTRRHFTSVVSETDFSALALLDAGGSQRGLLRFVYALRALRYGPGMDIAEESIAIVDERRRDLLAQIAAANRAANPLWPAWRSLIATNSNAPTTDYADEGAATAFAGAGFDIAKNFGDDHPLPAGKNRALSSSLTGTFDHPNRDRIRFRCPLRAGAN